MLQKAELPNWDSFVNAHQSGSIYHTSLWLKTIEETYGHTPVYLVAGDSRESITAGIPLFLVRGVTGTRLTSLPAAQYCNPLVSRRQEYEEILDFIMRLLETCAIDYLELKTSEKFHADSRHFIKKPIESYSTYTLDLDRNIDDIMRSFHPSCTLRAINRSYKNDLELAVGHSENDVKIFYSLYLRMRKGYGLLPQPCRFFLAMWKEMHPKACIEILHAKHRGRTIASILLLKYRDTVIYEYGASCPKMLGLKPNHFLLWEAIKRAKDGGHRIFDFGRTSNDNTGLTRFKERWGTERQRLAYYLVPHTSGATDIRDRKIPKIIMNNTVKHLPAPLCHLMGRLLYGSLV